MFYTKIQRILKRKNSEKVVVLIYQNETLKLVLTRGRPGIDGLHFKKIASKDWPPLLKRGQNTNDKSNDSVADYGFAYAFA